MATGTAVRRGWLAASCPSWRSSRARTTWTSSTSGCARPSCCAAPRRKSRSSCPTRSERASSSDPTRQRRVRWQTRVQSSQLSTPAGRQASLSTTARAMWPCRRTTARPGPQRCWTAGRSSARSSVALMAASKRCWCSATTPTCWTRCRPRHRQRVWDTSASTARWTTTAGRRPLRTSSAMVWCASRCCQSAPPALASRSRPRALRCLWS
mmetsp:Transcript_19364/g.57452  ORF Transcript_19364/g.57452 Transcript_19364/m.57452 type:complete len:210 (+) Transcript_19364:874-1503(+)